MSSRSPTIAGITHYPSAWSSCGPALIVVEKKATCVYESDSAQYALEASNCRSHAWHRAVRHFAKAQGLLAKSAGIDPICWPSIPAAAFSRCQRKTLQKPLELDALLVLRRQLIDNPAPLTAPRLTSLTAFRSRANPGPNSLRQIQDRIKQLSKNASNS